MTVSHYCSAIRTCFLNIHFKINIGFWVCTREETEKLNVVFKSFETKLTQRYIAFYFQLLPATVIPKVVPEVRFFSSQPMSFQVTVSQLLQGQPGGELFLKAPPRVGLEAAVVVPAQAPGKHGSIKANCRPPLLPLVAEEQKGVGWGLPIGMKTGTVGQAEAFEAVHQSFSATVVRKKLRIFGAEHFNSIKF